MSDIERGLERQKEIMPIQFGNVLTGYTDDYYFIEDMREHKPLIKMDMDTLHDLQTCLETIWSTKNSRGAVKRPCNPEVG